MVHFMVEAGLCSSLQLRISIHPFPMWQERTGLGALADDGVILSCHLHDSRHLLCLFHFSQLVFLKVAACSHHAHCLNSRRNFQATDKAPLPSGPWLWSTFPEVLFRVAQSCPSFSKDSELNPGRRISYLRGSSKAKELLWMQGSPPLLKGCHFPGSGQEREKQSSCLHKWGAQTPFLFISPLVHDGTEVSFGMDSGEQKDLCMWVWHLWLLHLTLRLFFWSLMVSKSSSLVDKK